MAETSSAARAAGCGPSLANAREGIETRRTAARSQKFQSSSRFDVRQALHNRLRGLSGAKNLPASTSLRPCDFTLSRRLAMSHHLRNDAIGAWRQRH